MDTTEKTENTTEVVEKPKGIRELVNELIDGASPERLEAAHLLFSLSDERAAIYGDALSLLMEANYNLGTLKQAVINVNDEQGLDIVRTRTKIRVFRYLNDEDDPASGFVYRAFYVDMITPEQKIAIGAGKADRLKEVLAGSFTEADLKDNPAKVIEFLNSESFMGLMVEPNKVLRKIVKEGMHEVGVDDQGNIVKPLKHIDGLACDEYIYQKLEEDLAMLIEQQGILVKNSPMTDM